MITTIRYILITALRDYLFLGLLAAVLLSTALSIVLGNTASVEKEAMVLAFSSASARVILMLGLIVFICFHIRQTFDQKEIDVLVSRPLSRFHIVLAYAIGFCSAAFLMVLPTVVLISFLPGFHVEGFYYWAASLLAESWMIVMIALFAALTLKSAVTSVIASLGFYTLARMAGFFIATADSGMLYHDALLNSALKWSVKLTALIIPRLDLFTQSEWLVYGVTRMEDVGLAAMQIGIYIPLLLIAATIDFMRKQF